MGYMSFQRMWAISSYQNFFLTYLLLRRSSMEEQQLVWVSKLLHCMKYILCLLLIYILLWMGPVSSSYSWFWPRLAFELCSFSYSTSLKSFRLKTSLFKYRKYTFFFSNLFESCVLMRIRTLRWKQGYKFNSLLDHIHLYETVVLVLWDLSFSWW